MNIQRIKERYEEELLLNPNVVGVGIGTKIIKGVSTQRQCIKIYVRKKMSRSKLKKNELIPQKLNGIETDVEEIGSLKAQAASKVMRRTSIAKISESCHCEERFSRRSNLPALKENK